LAPLAVFRLYTAFELAVENTAGAPQSEMIDNALAVLSTPLGNLLGLTSQLARGNSLVVVFAF
jgi:hypothetical protein